MKLKKRCIYWKMKIEMWGNMMTIVAAYRYGSFAIVMSDFRITHQQGPEQIQYDACMKYAQLGPQMGMFFAGDVGYIQGLIKVLHTIKSQLTTENVIDDNGPLRQTLLAYSQGLKIEKKYFQAIGFLFDTQFEKNEIFMLEGSSGTSNLQVQKLKSGKCTIIGMGNKVPGLQNALTKLGRASTSYKKISNNRFNQIKHRMKKPSQRNLQWICKQEKYDQETAASILSNQLKKRVQNCGSAVYVALGISPFFVTSLIGKSGFYMQGGTVVDTLVTSDFDENGPVIGTEHAIELSWDTQDCALYWSDSVTSQRGKVQEIENYIMPSSPVQIGTNPMLHFDPSNFSAPTKDVYLMDQWVQKGGDEEHKYINRTLYKQSWLVKEGFFAPNPCIIAASVEKPPVELERYKRSGSHVLFISDILSKEFEGCVASHVFDHEWLQQYIMNYESFYQ
ncbi:hypothetical protein PMSD_23840 [Paenibacillus macquariensis subsp. defensor]|nr:hypothetical protein PMSD_23840 [Paenibacillus macquariensis subsp. defensor]